MSWQRVACRLLPGSSHEHISVQLSKRSRAVLLQQHAHTPRQFKPCTLLNLHTIHIMWPRDGCEVMRLT
jgi:hypothetical protein